MRPTVRILRLLSGGLAGLALTGLACAFGTPAATFKASRFLDGQQRGFVIGRVDAGQDAAYFRALAATGANIGRIFLPLAWDAQAQRYVPARSDLVALRRVLGIARATHIKLIVVGDFERVQEPGFWGDAAQRRAFTEAWAQLARIFGNDPGIAGLDLLNEPNPPSPSGNLSEMQATWRALAGETLLAIRREGVKAPIVYESIAGAGALGFRDLEPLADPQVIYSVHFYTPHEITHQRVNGQWGREIPYPAGPEWGLGAWDPALGVTAIDQARLELELRPVIAFQQRYGLPVYVGEFSCVRWAPEGSALRYLTDVLAIFERQGWSWSYHEFRGWPGWDAEIADADPAATSRSADAPVMRLLRAHLVERAR
jgi:hypothetical protein